MKIYIFTLFTILMLSLISFGQNDSPYIQKSIGNDQKKFDPQPTATSKDFVFPNIEIKDWIGKEFIFLPHQKIFQKFGYKVSRFIPAAKKNKEGIWELGLPYDTYVGKVAVVTNVIDQSYSKVVELEIADTKEKIKGTIFEGQLTEFAFLDDLKNARKEFLNKTVWLNDNYIETYDEATDKSSYIKATRFGEAKITNVVLGFQNSSPIRFVLETADGKIGYQDIAISPTNVSADLALFHLYRKKFFNTDPKIQFKFSEEIWRAIEERKVLVGMTQEQAILSWGDPSKIDVSESKNLQISTWKYSNNRSLVFVNGAVDTINL